MLLQGGQALEIYPWSAQAGRTGHALPLGSPAPPKPAASQGAALSGGSRSACACGRQGPAVLPQQAYLFSNSPYLATVHFSLASVVIFIPITEPR